MQDYEIQRCTRRCSLTDRELQAGEAFYSVLRVQGATTIRSDISVDAWTGPPDDALAWWKSQLPDAAVRPMQWAPNDAMLQYFQELDGRPDQTDTRYLLALLMIRRRILRLEETVKDEQGREWLVLYCARNETEYRTLVHMPSHERLVAVQKDIAQMLSADAA